MGRKRATELIPDGKLGVHGVAERIGRSVPTVYKLMETGRLPRPSQEVSVPTWSPEQIDEYLRWRNVMSEAGSFLTEMVEDPRTSAKLRTFCELVRQFADDDRLPAGLRAEFVDGCLILLQANAPEFRIKPRLKANFAATTKALRRLLSTDVQDAIDVLQRLKALREKTRRTLVTEAN